MMIYFQCLSFLFAVFMSLQIMTYPVMAQPLSTQTLSPCDRQQEIFAFQMPNYATSLQGGEVLNFTVTYRVTPEASTKNDYPDLIPLTKEIDRYLNTYPNNNDYWEIINKKLVQHLLDQYPQMSSLSIELKIPPKLQEPFARTSIVSNTRSQGCPMR